MKDKIKNNDFYFNMRNMNYASFVKVCAISFCKNLTDIIKILLIYPKKLFCEAF